MASRGHGASIKCRDFERRVAKALTPLLGVGELRRVYISESTDHKRYPGDICRVDGGTMPMIVECKAQKFDLTDCMNDNANVRQWFAQADEHAATAGYARGRAVVVIPWRGRIAIIWLAPKTEPFLDGDPKAEFVCDKYVVEILREQE